MRGLWEERACAQRIGLELVDNLVGGQAELGREPGDRGRRDEDVAAPSRRMATADSGGADGERPTTDPPEACGHDKAPG